MLTPRPNILYQCQTDSECLYSYIGVWFASNPLKSFPQHSIEKEKSLLRDKQARSSGNLLEEAVSRDIGDAGSGSMIVACARHVQLCKATCVFIVLWIAHFDVPRTSHPTRMTPGHFSGDNCFYPTTLLISS